MSVIREKTIVYITTYDITSRLQEVGDAYSEGERKAVLNKFRTRTDLYILLIPRSLRLGCQTWRYLPRATFQHRDNSSDV